ncbi:hypothetical protein NLN82_27965, partial [Citrobacter portucalensis]|nr:hypothetical protein [Citrobacter portucalensis]
IATSWLKIDSTSLFDTAVIALKLMAISIIPQVMISLYYGGLMGLERQVNANAINICYSFLRSGAVIIPLYFWGNLISYFSWYLCVSCIFLLIFRLFLLKQIKLDKDLNEFVKEVDTNGYSILKGLYSFSLGMLFLSVISAVNNQLDRLYVSYKFTLKEFTYYNLSSILGQAAFLIVLPLAVTVLPNLTKLANEKKGKSYQGIYEQFSYYISGISATAVFSLI